MNQGFALVHAPEWLTANISPALGRFPATFRIGGSDITVRVVFGSLPLFVVLPLTDIL